MRHMITLLFVLLLSFFCHAQYEVFPNASPPGTVIEIRGLISHNHDVMVTLNGVSMPVVEVFYDFVTVEIPDTWSGWPLIFIDDQMIGEVKNQLYVIHPVYWEAWAPVPLISPDEATIVGVIDPLGTQQITMELQQGDVVAIDLVSLDTNTWYPHRNNSYVPVRGFLWPLGETISSTDTTGPFIFEAPQEGIYVLYVQSLSLVMPTTYISTVNHISF